MIAYPTILCDLVEAHTASLPPCATTAHPQQITPQQQPNQKAMPPVWYDEPNIAHRLGHPFVHPGGPSVVAEPAAARRQT